MIVQFSLFGQHKSSNFYTQNEFSEMSVETKYNIKIYFKKLKVKVLTINLICENTHNPFVDLKLFFMKHSNENSFCTSGEIITKIGCFIFIFPIGNIF